MPGSPPLGTVIDKGEEGKMARMRSGVARRIVSATVAAAVVVVASAPVFAATGDVTEFSAGITPGSQPQGIAVGPDGNLWFTEPAGHRIGRITPAGVVTEFPLSADATPVGITVGPDGNLWFTEGAGPGWLGRISTSGVVEEYPRPGAEAASNLQGIVTGPDGNLFVADPSGVIRIYTATAARWPAYAFSGRARAIATGPDGNLWAPLEAFSGSTGKIARLSPDDTLQDSLPGGTTSAATGERDAITVGPDGNLWFTEWEGPRIIRVDPRKTSGGVTEFTAGIRPDPAVGARTEPSGIAAGPDGNLWFTEKGADQIARITPQGTVTEFATGITPGAGPAQIVAGPDGNLWFTESTGDKIGRIESGATTSSPDASVATAILGAPFTTGGVLGPTAPDPAAPCGMGTARTWFTFIAPAAGFYEAASIGSVAPAAVCVFSGSAGALTRETVDEDGATGNLTTARAEAGFVAIAGHRYYVQVSGSPAAFHFQLRTMSAAPRVPVRMTPLDERLPSADGHVLAWTQATSTGFPYVTVTQPGMPAERFSSTGHYEWSVGLDHNRLVVQRADTHGHSDLLLYDIRTRRNLHLPRAVNTKGWDFANGGGLSGNRLVVVHGGTNDNKQVLALVDLRTGRAQTILTRPKKSKPTIAEASVAGNWISYTTGGARWQVHRYDIKHHTSTVTTPPKGQYDYSASVTADGTIYFTRGYAKCGDKIRIMRWRRGHSPEQVLLLPAGFDIDSMDVSRIGAITWATYAQRPCAANPVADDIYRIPVVVPGIGLIRSRAGSAQSPPPAAAIGHGTSRTPANARR